MDCVGTSRWSLDRQFNRNDRGNCNGHGVFQRDGHGDRCRYQPYGIPDIHPDRGTGLGSGYQRDPGGERRGHSSVVLSDGAAWTATSNSSFLHIADGSASGTGSAAIAFTYDAFSSTGTRSGTLTVAGLTVTVTQVGTNYIGPGELTTLVSSGLNSPAAARLTLPATSTPRMPGTMPSKSGTHRPRW